MNTGRLEKNICDTVKEWEIKLGYREEAMCLYYPLESLCDLLQETCSTPEKMEELLKQFVEKTKEHLGAIEVSFQAYRFCLKIPAEGVRYIHENWAESIFLKALLQVLEKPGCSLSDIRKLFFSFSNHVSEEKEAEEENSYLFCFEDDVPDEYVYCIHFDEFGATYHRFTKQDYSHLNHIDVDKE